MRDKNIDTLRQEAQRQLQQLKKLLLKAREKGLIEAPAQNGQSRATFDSASLPKTLEVLDGESHKLEHLDMVLAVVGTMKVGKSTSINAIVGAEVLPNRNRPMTALPTLIRHTPGVLRPRLVLERVEPLNQLLQTLQRAIPAAEPDTLAELQRDPDMAELLAQIQQNQPFQQTHEGEAAIFNFLKSLNDLVRLCFTLEEEFPFNHYATVDAMPVIEVEFSHLKNIQATQGRLTLLDTPGPNEAGQQHLRHMLKDQLKKASAVLAVLDYTQLKSDADNDVRANLLEISDTAKDRMYALVNKFDQKDRNSDDALTVKKYVSQTLMSNVIKEDHVFPVSSLQGYLASHARNEIERNGKLDPSEPWAEDFGKAAFGFRWERSVGDTREAKEGADHLWQDSGFAAPLEQVILEAYKNAALDALRSTAAKLEHIAKNTCDFLSLSVNTLKVSATKLRNNIDNLQKEIENIARVEKEVGQSLQQALAGMKSNIGSATEKARQETIETLEKYFKEGKQIEANQQKSEQQEHRDRAPEGFKRKKRGTPKSNSTAAPSQFPTDTSNSTELSVYPDWNELLREALESKLKSQEQSCDNDAQTFKNPPQDFDPNILTINFRSKKDAEDFQKKIEQSIHNLMSNAEETVQKRLDDGIKDFAKELERQRTESLRQIQQSTQKSLEYFEIEIRLPRARDIFLNESISSILSSTIEQKSEQVKKYRRQDGIWGAFCKFLNTSDWGWEEYTVEKEYYEVNLSKIAESTNKGINTLFDSAQSMLEDEVLSQLNDSVEAFFSAFREKIEHIRGDLIRGLEKHNLDKEQQDIILKNSTALKHQADGVMHDCERLHEQTETLRAQARGKATQQGVPA